MADKSRSSKDNANRDTNPDLITGAPGSHPIGTGVGAAGGGAAGAAIGTAIFPGVGTVVGAVVGAVAGGYAGKGAGEMIDPTGEREHWEQNYQSRPYVKKGETFDAYAPAYQYGWESRARHEGRSFDEASPDLERNWDQAKGTTGATWDKAKHAVRDAWDRVDSKLTAGGGASAPASTSHTSTSHASTAHASAGSAQARTTQLREGEQAIPVVEEELHVGKREVEKGGVRVQTHVTERPVEAQVNLREEHVKVERRPVDRPVSSTDQAFREQTIEATERAEQAVVGKEARVVEEVVVGKEVQQRTEQVRDTVRRTDVEVEQVDATDANRKGRGGSRSN